MKLIIVDRTKVATYTRLREQFADDPNVKVVFERRQGRKAGAKDSNAERRRLHKALNGRDYIVVHTPTDK
jgi:hypothetical protein